MERVEVRLAQFDVVVRDKRGGVVKGLRAPDFEVLEEGVPLEVVAVDEWGAPRTEPADSPQKEARGPARPEEARKAPAEPQARPMVLAPQTERRSLLILFDILNGGSPLRIHQAKRAAIGFLRTRLRPSDVAAVYQLDTTLRGLSAFTSDVGALERAVERVTPLALSDLSDDLAESILAYRSRAGVRYMEERLRRHSFLYTELLDWQREAFYRSLASLADLFAALQGRRVLVLLSGGFPMTAPGDLERETGGFTPAFRELIRKLGAMGVTVYSVDIGDDLSVGDVSRTIDWRVAVGKLGMDENVLADLGLDRALSSGSAGQRRQVLGVLAAETGGRLLTHGDLSRAFEVMDEESTYFYRISCRVPENAPPARYRKITVRVRRPELSVTARRGRYGDVVPAAPVAAGPAEELARYRPLSLRCGTALLPAGPGGLVPVVAVVEAVGPIELDRRAGGGAELDVDFFLVARTGEDVFGRYARSIRTRIRPGGEDAVRRSFRLEGRLSLPPGAYDLQATVRIGSPPQLGIWSGSVLVPVPEAPRGATLEFARTLLAPREASSPLLLRFEESEPGEDPLSVGSAGRVLPATEPVFDSEGGLVALFWLQGLPASSEAGPRLRVAARVRDQGEQLRPVPSELLSLAPDGDRGLRGAFLFDISSLGTGTYHLELEAEPLEAGAAAPIGTKATFRVSSGRPTGSSTSGL